MVAVWTIATVVLLPSVGLAAFAPRGINLESLTCDKLADNTEQLEGCRFSVITEKEQQVSCEFLVKHRDVDGIVTAYRKMMLNTMTFRLEDKMTDNVYCASLASSHLQIRNTDLPENHTVGDLPPAFINFLNFFTDDSYAHFNFTKKIPVAKIHLRPECHGLPRKDMRDDCIEKVMFLKEIKRGSFSLQFINDQFWSFLKRRYIEDFGGEMTHLSLTSSGLLSSVPVHFLTNLMTSDLRTKELTLANMGLGDLKGPLITMPTLRVLRLSDDSISSFSEVALQGVPELLELDLSGNKLEEVPASLPGSLVALNVSRNKLTALLTAMPASLVSLNASYNNIETLPDSLPASLRMLDVSHNAVVSLPQRLPPTLRLLNVSHNRLLALPAALPPMLNILQVSHNQLKTLNSQLLVPLQELQLLDASYNGLASVDDMWLSHHLQLLNVSHNALQRVTLLGPGNVTHIDASHNNIESWKVRAHQLSLAGNPRSPLGFRWSRVEDLATIIDLGENLLLNCDACSTDSEVSIQLRRWMIRQQSNASVGGPRVVRPTHPVCTDPQEQAGVALVNVDGLEDSSGCPGSPRYVAQFVLLLVSVLALIAALAVFCYYRRYEITYVLHLMKMRRERVAAERRNPCSYKYDAFVCYSSADRAWVIGQLLPKMEQGGESPAEPALRLCLHERDFPLGSFIADNIVSSMKNSRSTVVVLSQAFVDSQWCRWELELAACKVNHLVLLELQRLERSRLPRNLRYLMDTRTYLEWPSPERAQPAMWKRLRTALAAPAAPADASQPPADPTTSTTADTKATTATDEESLNGSLTAPQA